MNTVWFHNSPNKELLLSPLVLHLYYLNYVQNFPITGYYFTLGFELSEVLRPSKVWNTEQERGSRWQSADDAKVVKEMLK